MQNTTTYTTGLNGWDVAYYPEFDEYVCEACQTTVEDETGHDMEDCREVSRQRAEDVAADYRD